MPIHTFAIGPLDTNCYVVSRDGDALIVDPGGDRSWGLDMVLQFLERHQLTLRAVLLTHLHFDHTYGVAELIGDGSSVRAYAAASDLPLLSSFLSKGETWGLPPVKPFAPDPIAEGPCRFGTIQGEIRFTPGHSPGGLTLYLPDEKAAIVGDSLFYRSIGRTDLPGGHLPTLLGSIRSRLFSLPDDTIVYPGHGPSTTIGDEKAHNPML